MKQISYDNRPSLYLIPTPIGNMEDMTIRSINTLKMVDLLLCEDTRVGIQLLSSLDIDGKKKVSCHNFNEESTKTIVLQYLKDNKNVGLITDRGTPVISDPGYKIAKIVIEQGYNVIGLPGPTALIPALITSGIEPSPFLFYGFLNAKTSKAKKELLLLENFPYTIIFYEAPHRLIDTIKLLKEILGNRKISIHREISKKYESIYRNDLDHILEDIDIVKGEYVIIIEGNRKQIDYSKITLEEHVRLYQQTGLTIMSAIKQVAKDRNMTKQEVYKKVQGK